MTYNCNVFYRLSSAVRTLDLVLRPLRFRFTLMLLRSDMSEARNSKTLNGLQTAVPCTGLGARGTVGITVYFLVQ